MIIKNTNDICKFINSALLQYDTKAEFARDMQMSRSGLDNFLKRIAQGKGMNTNTLFRLLKKTGYQIKIEKI